MSNIVTRIRFGGASDAVRPQRGRPGLFGARACLIALAALGFVAAGCGDDDPIDTLNVIEDCNDVCSMYSECVTDIDVTECTDRCEDMIENTDAGVDIIDSCADCLEGQACAEALDCVPQCPPLETPAD